MKELSDLTWDYMQQQLDAIIEQKQNTLILEWILLPHSKYWKQCDIKILVTSDDLIRKNKVIERDSISEEYFAKRDSASIDYSPFSFDYVFCNDYRQESMNRMLCTIFNKIDFPVKQKEQDMR